MLDNMTGGRLVMGFMCSTITEDQAYGINPEEGRGRLMEEPASWREKYAGSVPSAQAGAIVSRRMQPRLLRYALALVVGAAALRIWFDLLS